MQHEWRRLHFLAFFVQTVQNERIMEGSVFFPPVSPLVLFQTTEQIYLKFGIGGSLNLSSTDLGLFCSLAIGAF